MLGRVSGCVYHSPVLILLVLIKVSWMEDIASTGRTGTTSVSLCDLPKESTVNASLLFVSSPAYPSPYGAGVSCQATVHAPEHAGIKVTVLDLEIEARRKIGCFDFLAIEEVGDPWSFTYYCGTLESMTGARVRDAMLSVHLLFKSDDSNQHRGFLLQLEVIHNGSITARSKHYSTSSHLKESSEAVTVKDKVSSKLSQDIFSSQRSDKNSLYDTSTLPSSTADVNVVMGGEAEPSSDVPPTTIAIVTFNTSDTGYKSGGSRNTDSKEDFTRLKEDLNGSLYNNANGTFPTTDLTEKVQHRKEDVMTNNNFADKTDNYNMEYTKDAQEKDNNKKTSEKYNKEEVSESRWQREQNHRQSLKEKITWIIGGSLGSLVFCCIPAVICMFVCKRNNTKRSPSPEASDTCYDSPDPVDERIWSIRDPASVQTSPDDKSYTAHFRPPSARVPHPQRPTVWWNEHEYMGFTEVENRVVSANRPPAPLYAKDTDVTKMNCVASIATTPASVDERTWSDYNGDSWSQTSMEAESVHL